MRERTKCANRPLRKQRSEPEAALNTTAQYYTIRATRADANQPPQHRHHIAVYVCDRSSTHTRQGPLWRHKCGSVTERVHYPGVRFSLLPAAFLLLLWITVTSACKIFLLFWIASVLLPHTKSSLLPHVCLAVCLPRTWPFSGKDDANFAH